MIRRAELKDAYSLNRINSEDLGYQVTLEKTKAYLSEVLRDQEHHVLFVFEKEGAGVVGYVHAEMYQTIYAEKVFNILGLAVSHLFRRQKIATDLMVHLEKEARHQGITGIRLNSGGDRHEAHLFYQQLGYENSKAQIRLLKSLKF